jgi:hypothetical protein
MVAAMGGCCQICGYSKSNNALEFHHIDPNEKEKGFGDLRANNTKWASLIEELRKCVMLCSNCHKEVHDGITVLPEGYKTFNEDYAEYKKTIPHNMK